MDNESNIDDGLLKFLEDRITRSGFSLESKTQSILVKKKFSVGREIPFFDKDEKKARSFDLFANKQFPDESLFDKTKIRHVGNLNLIIECKNIPGNVWVFSQEEDPEITIPDHTSLTDSLGKNDPARKFIPTWPIKNIPYVSGYDEFILDNEKTNSNQRREPKNIFSAIHELTKATDYKKNEMKKFNDFMINWEPKTQNYIVHFTFFQPVIIFTGKMFYAQYVNDRPIFKPAKILQMKKNYVSEQYNIATGEIHIVHFDALNEYLELVTSHYSIGTKKILEMQDNLRDSKTKLREL